MADFIQLTRRVERVDFLDGLKLFEELISSQIEKNKDFKNISLEDLSKLLNTLRCKLIQMASNSIEFYGVYFTCRMRYVDEKTFFSFYKKWKNVYLSELKCLNNSKDVFNLISYCPCDPLGEQNKINQKIFSATKKRGNRLLINEVRCINDLHELELIEQYASAFISRKAKRKIIKKRKFIKK